MGAKSLVCGHLGVGQIILFKAVKGFFLSYVRHSAVGNCGDNYELKCRSDSGV